MSYEGDMIKDVAKYITVVMKKREELDGDD